jgi:signal transduction histidine kinase/CheY-like chemotaxis protein
MRLPYLQVLLILVAFVLMVLLSYVYVSNVEHKNLLNNAENALKNTQIHIEADLREMEMSLTVISETIQDMIVDGNGASTILRYMTKMSERLIADERVASSLSAIYGYFDGEFVFGDGGFIANSETLSDGMFISDGGIFISGVGWKPPSDFKPKSRPWYDVAIESDGEVGMTETYSNLITGESAFTYSRRIFDSERNPLGVVCLDISLERVESYAVSANFIEGSYGILMNRSLEVIAHPIDSYLGVSIYRMNDGEAIANDVIEGKGFMIEREATSYKNEKCALFYKRLENGWYLFVLTPYDEYYRTTREMAVVISSIGFLLAAGLSVVMLSVAAARNKADERSRLMFEALPMPCIMWKQDSQAIECNNMLLKTFKLRDKNEFFERFIDFSPEVQPDGMVSEKAARIYFEKAIKEGQYNFEWIHLASDGEQIPCEVMLVRLDYKKEYVIIEYIRDLRRLKKAQAEIRKADERAQIMLDTTPLCINFWNREYKNVDCNQEAVNFFGLSSKKEYLRRFYELSPKFQPDGELSEKKVVRLIKETFEKGYTRLEWMHQKPDGEQIPCEVTLVRVKYDDDYIVVGFSRDLRELKTMLKEIRRVEVAEESNKAKSRFIARMSHEMRTPMNAILGIAEIRLQDETISNVAKEAWTKVYNSGYTLLRIINDVLDLSKIESGKFELIFEKYDIPSLINDTVYLNLMHVDGNRVEFELNVDENLPTELYGDELRIKQVLNNLLSNAFKYTEKGKVTLTITTESEAMSHVTTLILIVADTGAGMSEEQTQMLFDEYSRFNSEANRTVEGAGLGMNITQQLVNMMDGTITVKSELGKGSEFTVRLPQENIGSGVIGKKLAESMQKMRVKQTLLTKRAHIRRDPMPYGSVLLVDDVGTNIYVAQGLLAPYELKVDTALSGYEAIEKVKSGNVYDIIFMDHMMPKMDGIEATEIIRDLGYERPIVALTANAVAGQAELFFESGFDDYISKPIDIRQLNATLNRLVRDKYPPEIVEEARQKKSEKMRQGKPFGGKDDPHMIELFIKDAEKAVGMLEMILRKPDSFEEDDSMNLYIVNVHGVRNALINIGEKELSDVALKLERAGRDRDMAVISDMTSAFIVALKAVIEKIRALDLKEKYIDAKDEDTDLLNTELSEIMAACKEYDITTAIEAMDRLNKNMWSEQTKAILKTINEHLLNSDFEKAAEACDGKR